MKRNCLTLIIVVLAIVVFSAACIAVGIRGNGIVATQERIVKNYHTIAVGGVFDVVLVPDGTDKLVIEADSNLLNYVSTEVENGVLKIELIKHVNLVKYLKVYVHFSELSKLEVDGAADVTCDGIIYCDSFIVEASGGSDVSLNLEVNELTAVSNGGSDLVLTGKSDKAIFIANGGSDLKAFDLITNVVKVDANGASNVEVMSLVKLDANASGAADVIFKGKPTVITINKTGAADVKRKKN
jgi:hypothetical protein